MWVISVVTMEKTQIGCATEAHYVQIKHHF